MNTPPDDPVSMYGYRIIDPAKDGPKRTGDEYYTVEDGWRCADMDPFTSYTYRRRIDPPENMELVPLDEKLDKVFYGWRDGQVVQITNGVPDATPRKLISDETRTFYSAFFRPIRKPDTVDRDWIPISECLPDKFPCWVWDKAHEPAAAYALSVYPHATHWLPMQMPAPPALVKSEEERKFDLSFKVDPISSIDLEKMKRFDQIAAIVEHANSQGRLLSRQEECAIEGLAKLPAPPAPVKSEDEEAWEKAFDAFKADCKIYGAKAFADQLKSDFHRFWLAALEFAKGKV
jgi:hypothetical protein